jgi:hypothetical protein
MILTLLYFSVDVHVCNPTEETTMLHSSTGRWGVGASGRSAWKVDALTPYCPNAPDNDTTLDHAPDVDGGIE